jgi:hypothetical protein
MSVVEAKAQRKEEVFGRDKMKVHYEDSGGYRSFRRQDFDSRVNVLRSLRPKAEFDRREAYTSIDR